MPHPVVRTEQDEYLWERAKEIVRRQYKLTEEDGERFWRLVMGIYKRMKRMSKEKRLKLLVKGLRLLAKTLNDLVGTLRLK